MILANRRYWIFDMDGTLTVAVHDFDAIRDQLGLPQGRPILEQLKAMPRERAEALRGQLDSIEHDLALRARPQGGASELLRALRRGHRRLGILTRNSHDNALETLARCGLAGFFDPLDVLGREACDPKPSPDGILRLLRQWDAKPEEAVMVGDFRFDIEAGLEAGTLTIYADLKGENAFSDLADITVKTLGQLRQLVQG